MKDRELFSLSTRGKRRFRVVPIRLDQQTSLVEQGIQLVASCDKHFSPYMHQVYVGCQIVLQSDQTKCLSVCRYMGDTSDLTATLTAYSCAYLARPETNLSADFEELVNLYITKQLIYQTVIKFYDFESISFDPKGTRLVDDAITYHPTSHKPLFIHITNLVWWCPIIHQHTYLNTPKMPNYLPQPLLEAASLNRPQIMPVITLNLETQELFGCWVKNTALEYDTNERFQQVAELNSAFNQAVKHKLKQQRILGYQNQQYHWCADEDSVDRVLVRASSPLRRVVDLYHQQLLIKLLYPSTKCQLVEIDIDKLNLINYQLTNFNRAQKICELAYMLPIEGQEFDCSWLSSTQVKINTYRHQSIVFRFKQVPKTLSTSLRLFAKLSEVNPIKKIMVQLDDGLEVDYDDTEDDHH